MLYGGVKNSIGKLLQGLIEVTNKIYKIFVDDNKVSVEENTVSFSVHFKRFPVKLPQWKCGTKDLFGD